MNTPLNSPSEKISAQFGPQALAELERIWQAGVERQREQRREVLMEDAMLTLAAVPTWTAPLAEHVRSELSPGAAPADFEKLVADGFVQQLKSPLREEQTPDLIRFIMPEATRAEVFEFHSLEPEAAGRAWEKISAVGSILDKLSAELKMPDDTRQWAELARHADDPRRLVDELDARVRSAQDAAQIHRLLAAARGLEPLFHQRGDLSFDVAMQRAARRLELLRRKDDDRVHLRNFLTRAEQFRAVETLIGPDDEHWALHLVGAGGVGKTMLLRHLSSDFAEGRLAVSRVDFDYLNPDYPRLAPGLLLWAFGQDLRAYAPDGRTDRLLNEADRILEKLHEELRANAGNNPTSPIDHPQFQTAMRRYIDAMLGLRLRILLILDTCEELARIRPDGTVPENVRDTFGILQTLHEGVRGLRVIFSGRRPLASEGYGWRCSAAELPRRPCLRLHEIRGFTYPEALRYLEKAAVPEGLRSAIIGRCPDLGRILDAAWDDPTQAPSEEPRCSPYDLKLYAEWAAEEPHPSAETIAASTAAQYVEFRILRRLRHPELERLLPVIALLGHIDDKMLRHLTTVDDALFDQLKLSLRQQEWTNVRAIVGPDDGEPRRVYSVEPGLRKRLNEYAREHRAQWAGLLSRAARFLEKETLTTNLSALDWTDFDATRAALADSCLAERPGRWWYRVEQRLREQRNPAWTRDLIAFLCPSSGTPAAAAADDVSHLTTAQRVRPAIVAAYASALYRCGQRTEVLVDLWEEVWRTWIRHPLRLVGVRLRFRAAAGRVMAGAATTESLPAKVDDFLFVIAQTKLDDLDPDTAAAGVSAVDTLIELVELASLSTQPATEGLVESVSKAAAELGKLIERIHKERWMQRHASNGKTRGEVLVVWGYLLQARAALLCSADDAATSAFVSAFALLGQVEDSPFTWTDWETPPSLRHRVVLEYARAASSASGALAEKLKIMAEFLPDRLAAESQCALSIDEERTESLRLHFCLSDHVADATLLGRLRAALAVRPQLGVTAAQRAVPPLCCVAAEELAAAGYVDEAVVRLRELLRDSAEFHEEVRQELERAYCRIVLRFYLYEEGAGEVESLRHSRRLADLELDRALQAMKGVSLPLAPRAATPALLHIFWRTFHVADVEAVRPELKRWRDALPGDPNLALDAMECDRLLGTKPQRKRWRSDGEPSTGEPSKPPAEMALSLMLRRSILQATAADSANQAALRSQFGTRRIAEVALQEANLLSLRLPDLATDLARRAMYWFQECQDHVGTVCAGLAGIMALGPEGSRRHRSVLDSTERAWDQLARIMTDSTPPFPGTESLHLEDVLQQPGYALPGAPPGWQPMLRRLLLARSGVSPVVDDGALRHRIVAPVLDDSGRCSFPHYRFWLDSNRDRNERTPPSVETGWRMVIAFIIGAVAVGMTLYFRQAEVRTVETWLREFLSAGTASTILWLVGVLAAAWLWRQWFVPRGVRLWIRAFLAFGSFLVAILALFWLWMAVFLLQRPINPRNLFFTPGGLGFLALFVLLPLLPIIYVVWRLTRFIRVKRALREPLQIAVSEIAEESLNSAPSNEARFLRVTVRRVAPLFLPRKLAMLRGKLLESMAENRSVERPYREFAQAFRPEIHPLFIRMRRVLGLRWAILEIAADSPEAHGWPWEAVAILGAGSHARSPRAVPFHFRRNLTAGKRARPFAEFPPAEGDAKGSAIAVEVWHGTGSGAAAFAALWRDSKARRRFSVEAPGYLLLSAAEAHPHTGRARTANILHLTGTLHEDSGGLRLRLDNRDSFGTGFAPGFAPELVFRAEDIASPLDLCILQGEPFPNETECRSADRRRAALARIFAARLFTQGIPAVIVIPSLESQLAAQVVRILVRYVARAGRHGGRPFLEMLEKIRHIVAITHYRSRQLRMADLIEPKIIAARLTDPDDAVASLAAAFTEAGRRDLARWKDLPPEALTGLLLDELNPVLRKIDLAQSAGIRPALKGWGAWKARLSYARDLRNRALVSQIFRGQISDGRETTREEAWEIASDVCGFCADDWDGRFRRIGAAPKNA